MLAGLPSRGATGQGLPIYFTHARAKHARGTTLQMRCLTISAILLMKCWKLPPKSLSGTSSARWMPNSTGPGKNKQMIAQLVLVLANFGQKRPELHRNLSLLDGCGRIWRPARRDRSRNAPRTTSQYLHALATHVVPR